MQTARRDRELPLLYWEEDGILDLLLPAFCNTGKLGSGASRHVLHTPETTHPVRAVAWWKPGAPRGLQFNE